MNALAPWEFIDRVRNRAFELIEGQTIAGEVSFTGRTVTHPVLCLNVTFQGPVDLSDARIQGSLEFSGCVFERGLRAANCRVDGDLVLDRVRIEDRVKLKQEDEAVVADARGIRIEGRLLARDLRVKGGVCLAAAACRGGVFLDGVEVLGKLDVRFLESHGAFHVGPVTERDGGEQRKNTRPPRIHELSGAGMDVRGGMSLVGLQIARGVDLTSAVIGSDLSVGRCREWDDHENEIVCPTRTGEDFRLAGTTIRGKLSLQRAVIRGVLNVQSATITAGLVLGDDSRFGSIMADGAAIAGGVQCGGLAVEGNLRVEGNLSFRHGQITSGGFDTGTSEQLALIVGDLDLTGSHVEGDVCLDRLRSDGAVRLDDAVITGKVMATASTSVRRFSMMRTTCSADVDVTGLELRAIEKEIKEKTGDGCFDARGAVVGGEFRFCGKPARDSEVRSWTKIPGYLDLSGTKVGHLFVSAHSFPTQNDEEKKEEDKGLSKRGLTLAGASIDELEIVPSANVPGFPVPLDLASVQVRDWAIGDNTDNRADQFKGLLKNDVYFNRSTYVAVDRSLRERGFEGDADKVSRAMYRRDRSERWHRARNRQGKIGRVWKLVKLAVSTLWWGPFRFFAGYGTAPARLFWWIILPSYVLSTSCVYAVPSNIEPSLQSLIAMSAGRTEVREHPDPSTWSLRDAAILGLRFHLPLPEAPGRAEWVLSDTSRLKVRLWGRSSPATWPMDAETWGVLMLILNLLAWPPFIGFAIKRLFRQ